MNSRAVHITYASRRFEWPARALARSARSFGIESHIYRPDDAPVAALRRQHPDIMSSPKGAGYWLWKPFIIRDALERAAEGTAVLYTDAGMVFVADPAPLLALAADHPVTLFKHMPEAPTAKWTKRDAFKLLNADSEAYWKAPLLLGGIQLYRAGPEARRFVDMLCECMADARILTDTPNTQGEANLDEFVDHRHDQSVLSIVSQREKLFLEDDPTQWGNKQGEGHAEPLAGQYLYCHRTAGKRFLRWWLRWKTGRVLIGERSG